jgi:rubredoxin
MRTPGGLYATTLYEVRCGGCGTRSGLCDTEAAAKSQAFAQGYTLADVTWRCRACTVQKPVFSPVPATADWLKATLNLYRARR